MSDVFVRYGCDGCYRWTDDPDNYFKVEVRPFNTRGDLPERIDLYCPDCYYEREGKKVGYRMNDGAQP